MNINVVASVLFTFGLPLVRFWAQHYKPQKYEHVFYDDGQRIKLTIEDYKSAGDTQPVKAFDEDDLRVG